MSRTAPLRTSLAPLSVAALVAAETGSTLLLHRLGGAPGLSLPAGGPGAWAEWLRYGNPADVLVAAARVAALAVSWWLLVSTVLYWAARLARRGAPAGVLGRLTPAVVRRLVDGVVVVSVAGGLAGGRTGYAWARGPLSPPAGRTSGIAAPAAPELTGPARGPSAAGPVVLPADPASGILFVPGWTPAPPAGPPLPPDRRPGPAPDSVVSGGTLAPAPLLPALPLPAIPPSPSEAAVMPPKATAGDQGQESPEASGPPGAPLPAGAARAGTAAPEAAVWVVRPGDSFWRIAAVQVPDGRDPVRYWVDLVRANRMTIRSGDPDLIHPGETVTLLPEEDA
jgi:nucleoid-associated protein YgaU